MPTDLQAKARGFDSAKEWYVQTSTAYRHGQHGARPALEADFSAIPAVPEVGEEGSDEERPPESETEDEEVDPLQSAASGGREGSAQLRSKTRRALNKTLRMIDVDTVEGRVERFTKLEPRIQWDLLQYPYPALPSERHVEADESAAERPARPDWTLSSGENT